MIQVTYRETERNRNITIEGHANYAETGQDIVCAAVSGIAFSLMGYVENCGDRYVIHADVGRIEIEVAEPSEKTEAALEMALIGFMQVEMAHTAHVTVSIDVKCGKNKKNSGDGDYTNENLS